MKNILLLLLFIASFNIFGIGGTERVLKFEQMTTDLSNRDLKITPSGSGKVLLGGYSGVLLPVGTTAQRPGTPSVGEMRFNSTLAKFEGYASGAWSNIGGAGNGGIEYITNNDIEDDLTGYNTYLDVAGTIPVDGTDGTANVLVTKNTTLPLMGAGDLKFAKDAVNRQGEGVSYDFTIDNGQQAKKLIISFEYDASHANYADDDIGIFIYDVTNTKLIRINGENLKGGKGTHYAQFQTAPDSKSYRLIFHVASTNATAYDVFFDNISVGPQVINHGVVAHSEIPFTPTGSWTTNATYTGNYSRLANKASLVYKIALTGAPTATSLFINMPSGLTADTSALLNVTAGEKMNLAVVSIEDATGGTFIGTLSYWDGTKFLISSFTDTGTSEYNLDVNATSPITFASGDSITVKFTVPIQGWGSTAKMSSDFSGRDIEVFARSNDGEVVTASTEDIPFKTADIDTTFSWSNAGNTGSNTADAFTCPETGSYLVQGLLRTATVSYAVLAYVNGSSVRTISEINSTAFRGFGGTLFLNKGDVLTFRVSVDVTLNSDANASWVNIRKLASPQTQLENETVAARYTSNAGTQAFGGETTVTYEDMEDDTHNAMSGNTYTIPVSGRYCTIASLVSDSTAWTAGNFITIKIKSNAVTKREGVWRIAVTSTQSYSFEASTCFSAVKGDPITVTVTSSVASGFDTTSAGNTFVIWRVK